MANKLRLLKLSPECAQTLLEHGLTERHARALLRLEGEEARAAALEVILQRSMNVAQTEEYIESFLQAAQPKAKPRRPSFIIKDVRLFLNLSLIHISLCFMPKKNGSHIGSRSFSLKSRCTCGI